MKKAIKDAELVHLHEHLQYAVDLEFWTIPFYLSVMYSIVDKQSQAYQLIRSVANQEMLHLQCAANISNAFGFSPKFTTPPYDGTHVPHLNFHKDSPSAIKPYKPYTTKIGPLDLKHINAMCLIELPDYEAHKHEPKEFCVDASSYGTIGDFYKALLCMIRHHKKNIRGGVRQIDYFAPFYRNMPNMTVTESGVAGLAQIELLIELITEQGEGISSGEPYVLETFRNTADDPEPKQDHFAKFNQIKNATAMPLTFAMKDKYSKADKQLQQILIEQFSALTQELEDLFSGENPGQFFPAMASVGGAIRNCWQNGVMPKFS